MSFDKSERSTIKDYASRYGIKVTHWISTQKKFLSCFLAPVEGYNPVGPYF